MKHHSHAALAFALLPCLLSASATPGDPVPVGSRIESVTVFRGSAQVTRAAELSAGDGTYLIQGLPALLDPDSVRVRLAGGEVVGVEVRERVQASVPDERIDELRQRVRDIERELQVAHDEQGLVTRRKQYLEGLLATEEASQREDQQHARATPEIWQANIDWIMRELAAVQTELRESGWEREEIERRLADARAEFGACQGSGAVHVRDVLVDVIGTGAPSMRLAFDYVVGNAGWQPLYDLRTARDLKNVELVYRAKVWQMTGEDWKDVEVALSTALPQRGAQGPDPIPEWIDIARVYPAAAAELRSVGYVSDDEKSTADKDGARKAGRSAFSDALGIPAPGLAADAAPPPFAAVEDQGLSARFVLAVAETIESRQQPSTVLVGRAELSIATEHVCVPALDTTVWLRGKAKNDSDWLILPGSAAVYFGADYLGTAELGAVQKGQEFDLHLGADPGLVVERTLTESQHKEGSFLSNRDSDTETWKISVKNHGAVGAGPDGKVRVAILEVLPRSANDDIQVSLDEAKPKPSEEERWKKEREDKGVLAFVVGLAQGASTEVTWTSKISYPGGQTLERRRGP